MRRGGVSLIECLVAVATLAMLMGLLLPSLGGVRASARSTQCQNNLRQLSTAAQHYVSIFDAHPPALLYQSGEVHLTRAWDWVTTTFTGTLVEPGAIWAFTDHPGEVMQCPDCAEPSNSADPYTGYNYNTSYLGDEQSFGGPIRRGLRPHVCRRSAQCAVFGDGGWAGGSNKFMRAPLGNSGEDSQATSLDVRYAGGQAFRHQDSTNVAYLDGHVGSVIQPQSGLAATPTLLEQYLRFPRNGFLSDDDAAYDPR